MTGRIIDTFNSRAKALWGQHTIRLRHRLAAHEMFSDEGIADIIDSVPPERIIINTMATDGYCLESWSHCDRGEQNGKDNLDLVKSG